MSILFPQYVAFAGFVLIATNLVFFALHQVHSRSVLVRANPVRFFVAAILFLLAVILVITSQHDFSSIHLFLVIAILIFAASVAFSVSLFSSMLQHYETQNRFTSLLALLTGLIEARDPNLDGHSLCVCQLSLLLHEKLPLLTKFKVNSADLAYTALLLDVGKLGIPQEIAEKPGKFSKAELELVRRHPEIGEELIANVPGFKKIAEWIKYHHERVDGKGHFGLVGSQIPLASRIIAVADTFTALTMERSYKPSMPYEEAIAELRLVAGKQLDSELVNIFCAIPLREIKHVQQRVKEQLKKYERIR